MNLPALMTFFGTVYTFSNIPTIIIGLVNRKKLPRELKYLLVALIINFAIVFFSNLTVKWHWTNNIFLIYLSTINDAIFMTLFFYTIIKNNTLKKLILLIGLFCILLSIADAFWITGYENPNSLSGSVETFCVLTIGIYCLKLLIQNHEGNLLSSSLFYANSAIFLVNFFSLFPTLFNLQLYLYSPDLYYQFDIFVKTMLIIANIFYALAFWYAKPKTQTL